MKTLIALTFTIIGALLLAAPLIFSFLLAVVGNRMVTIHVDDRITCTVAGGLMLFVGFLFATIAFLAADRRAAKKVD